ncbi:MAG: pilus (MSHA type) biogenesis protein MshL [Nitrospirae bacterium]|nr:pilus (MSHA type) biogenesis protein MshL [Nitrospirota bacterium]
MIRSILCSAICALMLLSCASSQQPKKSEVTPALTDKEPPLEIKEPELKSPDFVPVQEDILPTQTRVVTIAARNTPLRDVLYTIAESANLNLVMERGVNPDLPITMTLNSISVENALNLIFDSVDYFYAIRDNILIVKFMDTKIFELGQPGVIHDYSIGVGGDILGGASSGTSGAVKGDVSLKSASDKTAVQFWDALENSLKTLLPASAAAPAGAAAVPVSSFTINRMTGTIMVTASKKDLTKIENYLSNLQKVLNRQVLIEARIIEVQLSDSLKYGIDWSVISNWRGAGTVNIASSNFKDVVSSIGKNIQIGITGSDFTSVIRALQTQGNVKTLSNPRVNIMNGQTAMLSAGRSTTYLAKVESTTTSEGGASTTTFTTNEKSILSGVMFGLVPFISEDGKITMTITPIISNLVTFDEQTFGTTKIKLPTVDLREMSTTVKISDGQMVIIGGLIDSKEELTENKVPILGSIPLLGYFFKSVEKTYEKKELVIMLIPKLANN